MNHTKVYNGFQAFREDVGQSRTITYTEDLFATLLFMGAVSCLDDNFSVYVEQIISDRKTNTVTLVGKKEEMAFNIDIRKHYDGIQCIGTVEVVIYVDHPQSGNNGIFTRAYGCTDAVKFAKSFEYLILYGLWPTVEQEANFKYDDPQSLEILGIMTNLTVLVTKPTVFDYHEEGDSYVIDGEIYSYIKDEQRFVNLGAIREIPIAEHKEKPQQDEPYFITWKGESGVQK